MAHVHYQFITQPSATFPLRPRSRFPSFLESSTPSFLLLAIRLTEGDRGGEWSGQERARRGRRQSERKRKDDEEKKRKREKQVETTMTSATQRWSVRGGYKIAASTVSASGAFTFLPLRLFFNPGACHECNLLHAHARTTCRCSRSLQIFV